mgnify:CR=1 FL=1
MPAARKDGAARRAGGGAPGLLGGGADGGAGGSGGGDLQCAAADPVRGGHHRERGAERGGLREAEGAPGELPVQVQEGPQPAALRQLPQRQEGPGRLQGARAIMLN